MFNLLVLITDTHLCTRDSLIQSPTKLAYNLNPVPSQTKGSIPAPILTKRHAKHQREKLQDTPDSRHHHIANS